MFNTVHHGDGGAVIPERTQGLGHTCVAGYIPHVVIGLGVMALGLGLALTYGWIRWMRKVQLGQYIRQYGPDIHMHKQGTPTMGGVVFVCVSSLLFWLSSPTNPNAIFAFLALLSFGSIGIWDDLLKFLRKDSQGLIARYKFFLQAVAVGALLAWTGVGPQLIAIPGMDISLTLPAWAQPLWVFFVFSGSTHAFNLTDGLDGLAGGIGLIALSALGLVAYVQGQTDLLLLLVLFGAALLAFLCFNRYPAKVFMGDTGAFALGALVAASALRLGVELYLFLFAVIPVLETLSVALQLGAYRLTHRRIFKIAPLHHHFEAAKGVDYPFVLPLIEWSEKRVTMTFWAVGLGTALVGLGLYFH